MVEAVKTTNLSNKETPNAATAPRVGRPWWRHALELSIFLPVSILALEAIFAWAGIGEQEFLKPDLSLGCVHIPGKLVTWRLEGFSRDYLSPQGLRDVSHELKAAPNTFRIALLGDSATEGLQVPLAETFPRLLEAKLNADAKEKGSVQRFEVINFGCSSYSTGQEVLTYEKYIRAYKPNLVMAMYTRGDTLENSIDFARLQTVEARPYFYLDGDELKEDDSILLASKEKLSPHPVLDFLRSKSRIYGVYNQTIFSLTLTDKIYNRFARLLGSITDKIKGKKPVPVPGYAPQDGFKVTAALLNRLNRDVLADGGKFFVLSFPDIGTTDKGYAADQAMLANAARAGGYDLINPSDYFKAQPNAGEQYLQVHLSKSGHASLARVLDQYISKITDKK